MTNTNEVYLQNAVDTAVMNTTAARVTYLELKNMTYPVCANWAVKYDRAGDELIRLAMVENMAKAALATVSVDTTK